MRTNVRTVFDLPTRFAAVPFDLALVLAVTVLADVAVLVAGPRLLRLGAAALLLFFLPGYAVVAALYPRAQLDRPDAAGRVGIGLAERLALSFGASVAIVPLVGLTTWQIATLDGGPVAAELWRARTTPLAVLTVVVVGGCTAASVRRSRLPDHQRFALPYGEWIDAVRQALGPSRGLLDRVLTVALAASVLLAVGSLGYALATPVDGEQYTSASLLAPGADGEPVASGYPTDLAPGERAQLVLELGNHEGRQVDYSVVVRLEEVRTSGDGSTVTGATELERLAVTVGADETRTIRHTVTPRTTGDRLRLTYYVYRGDAPATPSRESAYRVLYLWLSVGEG